MLTKRRLQALKRERQHGIGRLLLLARRDFLSRLAHKLHDKGGAGLVHAASGLLPFIDLEGTRSTELARRLGISKQAVGKAVRDLENEGLLTRATDTADGRAFLVLFTDKGVNYLLEVHKAINQIEREYDAVVGPDQMVAVRAALGTIVYPDQDADG
ncbi:MAG: winged helix DNA-binding protein [Burkholderiaceae bacterium]|nr:winged helix DNA-binding protein [Burkholderiaceae bacterium]MBP7658791.1 winged helix DNA-binding protein [Burkholderiaceae bacterium]